MPKKGFDWESNHDMLYLLFIIMKNLKCKTTNHSIERIRELYHQCAEYMTLITGIPFTKEQVEGQCFITGDFKLNQAKLRNLQIAIEVGYIDSKSYENEIVGLREKKLLRVINKNNRKVVENAV